MYRQALREWPGHLDSQHMLGLVLGQRGHTDEAVTLLEDVLRQAPEDFGVLTNLASILGLAGRHEAALAPLRQLLKQAPDNPDVLGSLSEALRHAGRLDEALAVSERALAISPGHLRARLAHANALKRAGRFDESLANFDQLLAEHPQTPEILNDRGNVLFDLRRFEEALIAFDLALAARPAYADAIFNRCNTLRALHRFDEAIEGYDQLSGQSGLAAEALNNRGASLEMTGRYEEALQSYAAAQAANPSHVMAHLNAALCHLLLGQFEQGWPLYRWRMLSADAAMQGRAPACPEWDGEAALGGRSILVLCEQGLGDSLQFCRLLTALASRGARVVFEVQPALKGLLSGLEGIDGIVEAGEPRPATDFHVWLLDLPGLLGVRQDTIPLPVSGLTAAPGRVQDFSTRLQTASDAALPRIGLAWSGNARHSNDHKRSLALALLAPLLKQPACFVSLQPEVRPGDSDFLARSNIVDLQSELVDFEATAALIASLDLVICVDTSVAHLAATLGRPVWLMLPAKPDWRWQLQRSDSPWYPSVRLFRQPRHDDWHAVIADIEAALPAFMRSWQARLPR